MINIKTKKFIFIIMSLSLIIITITSINISKIKYKDLEYKKTIDIKIGDEIPKITDYVNKENIERLDSNQIEWKDLKIEENKIYIAGNYEGYMTFRNRKLTLKLNVIDDEKPKIEDVKDITIYVNNKIDLLKNIKTTDNSKDEIKLEIKGNYDINKVGEYNLSYVATDKSNNQEIKKFKLIVKEKGSENKNETIIIGTTSRGYTIEKRNGVYYIDNILIANKTYKLPSSYAPGGLKSNFNNAFDKMKIDAKKDGINLYIISGYRSYSSQNYIYNNYAKKDGKAKADTYSARAGHSEHQTGLAADINSLYTSFINTKEGKWLNDNCHKYGFIIRYPKGKESITGYMYEPWHIRYVGTKISTKLYNNSNWISLEEYLGITSKYSG